MFLPSFCNSHIKGITKTKILKSYFSITNKKSHLNSIVPYLNYLDFVDVDEKIRKLYYSDTCNPHDNEIPVLILAGTAQTIKSWEPHILQILKRRRVITPELRGQGIDTSLLAAYGSMTQYALDLGYFLGKIKVSKVDIIGFSFGGRVGLSLAASNPNIVRKLSITGVPLKRPGLGSSILFSWIEGLKAGNIRECAWSFIFNGYSESFIEKNHHRLS